MKLSERTLPQVPEWITFSDAASLLKLSRQNVHVMAQNNKFTTLAKLGEVQPVYVVKRAEVQAMVDGEPWYRRGETEASEKSGGKVPDPA